MANYPNPPSVLLTGGSVTIQVGKVGSPPANILQLPVNPDQQVSTDIRVQIFQTESGIYADDYGQGLTKITLTGNTAWVSPQGKFNGIPANGYECASHLYRDIISYYFQQEHGNSNPTDMEMTIFDGTTGGGWQVKPIPPGLTMTRTKTDPMAYHYTATFIVIRDLMNDPASPDQKPSDPVMNTVTAATSSSASKNVPHTVKSAASTAQTVSQTPPTKYTVVSGDSLWSIATKYYNNGTLWPRIYNQNKQYVKNPNLIFPGQVLTIPVGPGSNKKAS